MITFEKWDALNTILFFGKYKGWTIDDIEMWAKAACNECEEFTSNKQSKISCRYCRPTQILNVINKAKEQ